MTICTRPMRNFISRTSIAGLSRSVCFLRSWAGRSSGVPPDLFIKKEVQFALSSRAALFWRARDLGAPCECLAFFARREIARLARIPMGKLHQARASIAERRSAPTLRSVGMSCAETLAGEAIGGYRLKTPASQIASYSSQETELAALVSRKSFCILLWPLRGDQVSSGRDGKSRLPA